MLPVNSDAVPQTGCERTVKTGKWLGKGVVRFGVVPLVFIFNGVLYGTTHLLDKVLPESWQWHGKSVVPVNTSDFEREIQLLRQENERLRAQAPIAQVDDETGPVRKPYPHEAEQLWAQTIQDELSKFQQELTTQTKRELYKLLTELGIASFDGKANTYRVTPFRSEELNENGEEFALRKLEKWLGAQKTLLINPMAKEGFIQFNERQLDGYFRGSSKKAGQLADTFGLPRKPALKESGLCMWRLAAFELTTKHKMLHEKELEDLNDRLMRDDLEKGRRFSEVAKQQELKKVRWQQPGTAQSSSSMPLPPPPPPPLPTALRAPKNNRPAFLAAIEKNQFLLKKVSPHPPTGAKK